MKVDKIVFSSSELFSPFWNLQSKIWKTKFGIHPICLLFGKKENCDVSEEYGDVIEMSFDPNLPPIIQIQFSKFYHTTTELNTTWMIGDMDLIPLQTEYYTNILRSVPDDSYCHLNYSMCGQMWGMPSFAYTRNGCRLTGGFDLPAHQHCAKGHLFKHLFFGSLSFHELLSRIVSSRRYGMIDWFKSEDELKVRGNFWVAEETYTSEMLWNYYAGRDFRGFHLGEYNRAIGCLEGKYGSESNICPKAFDGKNYLYDESDVIRKRYVEVHCPLPFENQKESLEKLLKLSGMI